MIYVVQHRSDDVLQFRYITAVLFVGSDVNGKVKYIAFAKLLRFIGEPDGIAALIIKLLQTGFVNRNLT